MHDNIWINRHLKRKLFSMPTSYSGDDRELEFENIKGSRIPALIEFWTWHQRHGTITVQEHRAIMAIIVYQFETQALEK